MCVPEATKLKFIDEAVAKRELRFSTFTKSTYEKSVRLLNSISSMNPDKIDDTIKKMSKQEKGALAQAMVDADDGTDASESSVDSLDTDCYLSDYSYFKDFDLTIVDPAGK